MTGTTMKLGRTSPFLDSLEEAHRHAWKFPGCVRVEREITHLAKAFRTVRLLEDINRNKDRQ